MKGQRMESKGEIVRVFRIIEYVGPRDWVERTVQNSIHGTKNVGPGSVIKAVTIGTYPEILENVDEG